MKYQAYSNFQAAELHFLRETRYLGLQRAKTTCLEHIVKGMIGLSDLRF
jgi:hypothetical protein